MAHEKFHYTLPDGYEVVLPRFESMPTGLIRRVRKLPAVDQLFTVLEEYATKEDLEHIDLLEATDFNELSKAWQKTSAVSLGES